MNKTKKIKIALLMPYFGKWPEWIDLFFNSCEKNEFIDYYFFTDCPIPERYADNLKFKSLTFADYCQIVSTRLNIDFHPKSAYKLCGLRPFYAHVHKDLLEEYDFWGFGDLDVIWGDIHSFYTDKMLKYYNVFSTHSDRCSGHLSIIRNNEHYRELCFKIKDWKSKLLDDTFYALDEQDLSYLVYPETYFFYKVYRRFLRKILHLNWRNEWVVYYKTMPILNALTFMRLRKLYFKEQHTTPWLSDDGLTWKDDADTWYYNKGEVTNNKTSKKYIYIHFMIFKKNQFRQNWYWKDNFYKLPSNCNFSDSVVISKDGISIATDIQ